MEHFVVIYKLENMPQAIYEPVMKTECKRGINTNKIVWNRIFSDTCSIGESDIWTKIKFVLYAHNSKARTHIVIGEAIFCYGDMKKCSESFSKQLLVDGTKGIHFRIFDIEIK